MYEINTTVYYGYVDILKELLQTLLPPGSWKIYEDGGIVIKLFPHEVRRYIEPLLENVGIYWSDTVKLTDLRFDMAGRYTRRLEFLLSTVNIAKILSRISTIKNTLTFPLWNGNFHNVNIDANEWPTEQHWIQCYLHVWESNSPFFSKFRLNICRVIGHSVIHIAYPFFTRKGEEPDWRVARFPDAELNSLISFFSQSDTTEGQFAFGYQALQKGQILPFESVLYCNTISTKIVGSKNAVELSFPGKRHNRKVMVLRDDMIMALQLLKRSSGEESIYDPGYRLNYNYKHQEAD